MVLSTRSKPESTDAKTKPIKQDVIAELPSMLPSVEMGAISREFTRLNLAVSCKFPLRSSRRTEEVPSFRKFHSSKAMSLTALDVHEVMSKPLDDCISRKGTMTPLHPRRSHERQATSAAPPAAPHRPTTARSRSGEG